MARGIVESFKAASLMKKLVFLVLIVAVVCNFIAFTTTGWGMKYTDPSKQSYNAYGLWRMCSNANPIVTGCSLLDGIAVTWFSVTQAFAVFGFAGINVAFMLVTLQIFTSRFDGVKDLNIFNGIQCFVTAACWLIAICVFGVFFDSLTYYTNLFTSNAVDPDLGYSFALSIVALILQIISGVLILLDGRIKSGGVSGGVSGTSQSVSYQRGTSQRGDTQQSA